MKRFLSILLALMIVCSLMTPVALADVQPSEPGTVTDPVEPTAPVDPEPSEEPEAPVFEVTPGNNPKTGKITLRWAAVDGAAKYEVYRSGSRAGEYTKYYTTTNLSYTNTSSNAGYWYFYKVKALDAEGNEIVTSDVISRCADCAAPAITAGNNAKTGQVTLKWEKVSGASKYEIYRALSKDGDYVRMYTTVNNTYTNTSSKANVTYYYKVVALSSRTAEADSAPSNIAARTCDCAAPSVTTGNNAETGKVTLKWKAVDGAAKYEVYRATTKNGTYSKYYTTSGTSYTNTSAYAGYTYYYKVKAISAVLPEGNSSFSSIVSRTCDCAMPTLKLLGYDEDGAELYEIDYNDNGNIIFEWKKVSGATSYKVYRSGSANGEYKLLGETKSTTFTDKTATAGYYYYYKIVALSSRSSYATSAAFEGVAAPSFPMAKNLKQIGKYSIDFTWSAIKGVDGYIILRSSEKTDISNMTIVDVVTDTEYVERNSMYTAWFAVVGFKERSDGAIILSVPAYIHYRVNPNA